jgi:membrane dipeptidase
MIVDAHLDLAYNVTRGRDVRMRAKDQPVVRSDVDEIATVGLPDLRAGGVGLICATIFCAPSGYGDRDGYTTAEEARAQALRQLAWYRQVAEEGLFELVLSNTGVSPVAPHEDHGRDARAISAILLMEGADAIRSPEDVQEWFDAGVRIVGLAWRRTRMAGGTGAPGPITPEGRAVVKELDRVGIIHDGSHLAEQAFWDLMELSPTSPIMASHSNCRSIIGEGDRHLTDEMIQAIVERHGVIGINFYDQFLVPASEYGKRRATLNDVIAHIKHICDLAGDAKHVGIGTDMDGGLGRDQIPRELTTIADLPKVGEALSNANFSDDEVTAIMAGNWLRFFRQNLPAPAI